jgi:hypothetical protein
MGYFTALDAEEMKQAYYDFEGEMEGKQDCSICIESVLEDETGTSHHIHRRCLEGWRIRGRLDCPNA